MPRPARAWIVWLVIVGFVVYLAWSTLAQQRVSCEVCVSFAGGNRCARASADNRRQATEAAQTTACGPLARGMDASIACGKTTPRSVNCQGA